MKVVLINPPQNTKYPQPPMGLALLGAILERDGYSVRIVDCNVSALRWADINTLLLNVGTIGITAMTPTITEGLKMAQRIKEQNGNAHVILGGSHATLFYDEILARYPEVDTVVVGEGDNAIIPVVLDGIKGVYKGSDVSDLDDLPFLAYHLLSWREYIPHPPHGRALPFLPMITSRGCPFQCAYCSKAVFGNKFRAQSPKRVVDELAYYKARFGAREVAFYDDVFTLDKKRVHGIVDEMLRSNLNICWTCETRADLVDKELLHHMKKAGCYSISYGVESASQDILDVIGKGITLELTEEAIKRTREAGIQTIGYFMVGSPNETLDTILATIKFAKKLRLDYAQFAITTPFPGTKLYDYYMDGMENVNIRWEDFVYAGMGNRVSPVFENEALSRGDIEAWVSRAYKEFYLRPPYVGQRLSRIRSVGDVKVLVKGLAMLREM